MEPQDKRPGETSEQFAERVRDMIADRAGLRCVPWDGLLKYYRPSAAMCDRQRQVRLPHSHEITMVAYPLNLSLCRLPQAFADRMKRHLEGSATPRMKARRAGGGGEGGEKPGDGEDAGGGVRHRVMRAVPE